MEYVDAYIDTQVEKIQGLASCRVKEIFKALKFYCLS